MKYRGFGLLECKVLCENRALADLGVRSDIWLPFMLDLETVQAVKLAVDDEHEDSVQFACAQILFKGAQECMVVDVKYHDMKRMWLAFKSGTLTNERTNVESTQYEAGNRRVIENDSGHS